MCQVEEMKDQTPRRNPVTINPLLRSRSARLETPEVYRLTPNLNALLPVDADARSLLLHGHSDRAEDAEHRRADWASHFILRLACCGGSSSVVSPEERRLGGGVARRGEEGKDRPGSENGSMAWRKERQEWFFAAEKELFEARLHRHTQCGQGRQAWEGGKGNENGKVRLDAIAAVASDGSAKIAALSRSRSISVSVACVMGCSSLGLSQSDTPSTRVCIVATA